MKLLPNYGRWTETRNVWLSIVHVPGITNVDADRERSYFHKETEWQLSPVFKHVVDHIICEINIDMMGSRTNCQVSTFVSWRPDPEAVSVEAFTIDWSSLKFWCLPPLSLTP